MRANNRASALAVDVEIANVEFALGDLNLLARTCIDGAGQPEFGVVGDFECVFEVP